MNNYRPISLLTSFSKIFEKVLQRRLLNHLTEHNILVKEQYAFRTNLKTDNSTYHLTNEILKGLNDNKMVGAIFCDLEKAFDCVNHKILLTKLKFYGITDNHYKLYKSYLINHYQKTLLYNKNGNIITSARSKVKQGVPQGSVLGPLLFLIYINDLPKFVNEKSVPILFADDTSILVSHPNPVEFCNTINTVFQILSDWIQNNLLSLNLDKTHFIRFVTKNKNLTELNSKFDNKLPPITTTTKFLGLTVNCSLTWTNHIDFLTKKLSKTCYLIRNIKPYLSISTLRMVYHSLFHSVMSFGIMFWGNSPYSPIIFKMQKRVLRILEGVGYRDSCRELFKELKILTLSSQYILSLLLFVTQNRGLFVSNSSFHNFDTRQ